MNTDELFGRYASGIAAPEDYVRWAEEQLAAGVESENVAILAGLDLEKPIDTEKVRWYFARCVRDLGMEWPDKVAAKMSYSEILCRRIVEGSLSPSEGLSRLAELSDVNFFPDYLYEIWGLVAEDIAESDEGYGPIFNTGATKDNADEFVRRQAIQYLRLASLDLPEGFMEMAWCPMCCLLIKPVLIRSDLKGIQKARGVIFPDEKKEYAMVCPDCHSEEVIFMTDYEGREKYLESLKAE